MLAYNFSDTQLYPAPIREKNRLKTYAYVAFDVLDSNDLPPQRITLKKPEPPFMRIVLTSSYGNPFTPIVPINKFFLKQREGIIIEKSDVRRSVEVELALSDDGIPVLINLFYTANGKQYQVKEDSSF